MFGDSLLLSQAQLCTMNDDPDSWSSCPPRLQAGITGWCHHTQFLSCGVESRDTCTLGKHSVNWATFLTLWDILVPALYFTQSEHFSHLSDRSLFQRGTFQELNKKRKCSEMKTTKERNSWAGPGVGTLRANDSNSCPWPEAGKAPGSVLARGQECHRELLFLVVSPKWVLCLEAICEGVTETLVQTLIPSGEQLWNSSSGFSW